MFHSRVYIKKKPVYHPPSYAYDDYAAKAAASNLYEKKVLPPPNQSQKMIRLNIETPINVQSMSETSYSIAPKNRANGVLSSNQSLLPKQVTMEPLISSDNEPHRMFYMQKSYSDQPQESLKSFYQEPVIEDQSSSDSQSIDSNENISPKQNVDNDNNSIASERKRRFLN